VILLRDSKIMRSVLVVGDSFCDVNAGPLPHLPQWGRNVVSPEAIVAHPGGAALNVASNLARLGIPVALYTGIGNDAFGDMLRRHCASLGVRLIEATPTDRSQPTGVCMVLSGREDRAFCSHFGVSDYFDAAELIAADAEVLREIVPPLGHVHCAGFFSCALLRKSLPSLLACCKRLGVTTSLDTNNDASGQWGRVDGLWDTLVPQVDLFTPNELEAW
jgi:sugar/nucleoside kinase (ribokinase family)